MLWIPWRTEVGRDKVHDLSVDQRGHAELDAGRLGGERARRELHHKGTAVEQVQLACVGTMGQAHDGGSLGVGRIRAFQRPLDSRRKGAELHRADHPAFLGVDRFLQRFRPPL